MKLFGYEIIIKKIPKESAESIFSDIEYELRDSYGEDNWLYFLVNKSVFEKVKRLAKEDYDRWNEDDKDLFPSGEDISYYRFEIMETKFFRRVLFRVKNR